MSTAAGSPRERFIAALKRRPLGGRVPHFGLVFFQTMEAFGRIHPAYRNYSQWDQMEAKEREMHRRDMAQIHIMTGDPEGLRKDAETRGYIDIMTKR